MTAQLICTEQGKRLHIGVHQEAAEFGQSWRAICGQPVAGNEWTWPTSWLGRGRPMRMTASGRTRPVCRACIAEAKSIASLVASMEVKP